MRLLPLQIEMSMLAGEWLPFCEPDPLPLAERLERARSVLIKETGCDFGYDLRKWHDHLVANHRDGYCWSNQHLSILARIREAEADPAWRAAVATLEQKR
jgi:hypothetical protein